MARGVEGAAPRDVVAGSVDLKDGLFSFDGAEEDMRSCVASAEPRKRLCGITVAPRIPTASARISWWSNGVYGRVDGLHRYKPPGWKTNLDGRYPWNARPQ